MVRIGKVKCTRGRAHLRLHGHDLSAQPIGRAHRIRSRRRVGQFVVGEGGVEDRAVGLNGQGAVAVGVILERGHIDLIR